MTIDEAIKYHEDMAEVNECAAKMLSDDAFLHMDSEYKNECRDNAIKSAVACKEYRQLAEWLRELKELSLQIAAPRLGSIEEYHYELAKCKAAFWSCNRSCMDAKEQCRRKADELRKAQEQIAEYKRLLKSATKVLNMFIPCDEDYNCSECIKQRQNCDYDDSFKWRYLDEALKLLGGSENG